MIDEDELARIEGMRSPIAVRLGKSATILPRGAASRTHSPRLGRRLKAIQKIEVNNETFAVVAALDHERVLSDAGLLLSSAAVGCPKL